MGCGLAGGAVAEVVGVVERPHVSGVGVRVMVSRWAGFAGWGDVIWV